MKATSVNKMKLLKYSTIKQQLGVLSLLILSSCGQNSHMTLDAVTAPTDITAPTANLSGGASGTTNTALQTITVTFSEAVVSGSISSGDFNIINGVLSNLSCLPALAPTACTFDVTASGQGAVSVVLPASAVQDAAGNSNDASNAIAWTFDSVGPTVSIAVEVGEPASGSSTNDSSIALTLTSSEVLAGLVPGDFTCTNCTVSGISGTGINWTLNVITSGVGAVSVELAASAVQDGAGNSNVAASNNLNWTYNNVAPALTLAPASGAPASGSTTNTSPIAVELTSSAVVTGLVAGDIVCTGCTINNFSGSGASYSFNVLPSGQGAFSVNVPASVAQDAATNQNTASNTLNWSYDTSAPSATLAVGSGGAASGSTTNAASIPITVSMGESVTGLVAGDFTCTNCTLSGFSGSGANYSFNVIPTSSGAVSVQLPATSAADAAGNGNTVSNSLAWTFDNTPPTVVLSGAPSGGYGNAAQTITATFSEAMNTGTLSGGDVSVTNGTISGFSCSGSPTECTFIVTPSAQGTVTIAMSGSVAQDNAGNNNSAATNISWVHDTTAPTVVISSTASSPTATSPIPIEATWSELIDIPTLVAGDFVIGNGSIDGGSLSCSNLPLVTPTFTKCSMTVTPSADGTVTVNLAASRATDLAGNGNTAASQFSITYSAGTPADSSNADHCHGVAVDSSGNVYCAGRTYSSLGDFAASAPDFFITKFDSNGDLVWIRQAGQVGGYMQSQIAAFAGANGGGDTGDYQQCNGVAVDGSGNVYCAGVTYGSLAEGQSTVNNDAFIVKLDSAGDLVWIRQFGNTGGYSQSQLDSQTSANGGGETNGAETCRGVAVDASENVYCAGETSSGFAESFGGGSSDIFVIKLNSSGDLVWARQAGTGGGYTQTQISNLNSGFGGGDTSSHDICFSVAVDSSGNVYCGGTTGWSLAETTNGLENFLITKFDSNGDLLWMRQSGGPGSYTYGLIQSLNGGNGIDNGYSATCRSIAVDTSENVYCGGETAGSLAESNGGSSDFFLTKFNSSGDLLWIRQAGSSGYYTQSQIGNFSNFNGGGETNGQDFCLGVAVDTAGNVYCSGTTYSRLAEVTVGSGDSFVSKFDSSGDLVWIRQVGTQDIAASGTPPCGDSGSGTPPCGDNDFDGFDDCDPTNSYIPPDGFDDCDPFGSYVPAFDGGGYTQSQLATLTGVNGGGSTQNTFETSLAVDSSGNVYCAGIAHESFAETQGGGGDFFIMKYDSSGDIVWARQAGGSGGYTYSQLPPLN